MTLVMRESKQQQGPDEEECKKTFISQPVIQANIAQQAGLLLSGIGTYNQYGGQITVYSKCVLSHNEVGTLDHSEEDIKT